MKKQLLVSALAVGLLSGSTAFAAENPFTSIPKDHWAYAAVEQLVQDGLVDGYGDEDFRGEKNITRYESAQLLAKAMTNISKANDADKALIARLQKEYADELHSFDIRLAEVEKKASSFKWTGDARIRYQTNYGVLRGTNPKLPFTNSSRNGVQPDDQSSRIQMRVGLNIEGTPAENLTVKGRITAEDTLNENTGTGTTHTDTTHRNFYIDRLELDWQAKNDVEVDIGRMTKSIGQGLIWWNNPIDGVSVEKSFANKKAGIMVGAGDINPGISYYGSNANTQMGFFANAHAQITPDVEVTLGYLNTHSNNFVQHNWLQDGWYTPDGTNWKQGIFSRASDDYHNRSTRYELGQLALGINAKLGKKLSLVAEGVHNSKGDISYSGDFTGNAGTLIKNNRTHKNGFWTRLTYGDQELKKAKNYNVYLEYAALGGAAIDSTGFAHRLNFSGGNGYGGDGARGWGIGANYMLADNANLEMNYYHMKPYDEGAADYSDYRSIFNTTLNFFF